MISTRTLKIGDSELGQVSWNSTGDRTHLI